jgi:hypothetical protein
VHDAFDRDDVVDGVEGEVSAKTGSIRGHVVSVADCLALLKTEVRLRFDMLQV